MMRRFRKLVGDARGGTAIEYGLIVALVVIVLLAALIGLAGRTIDIWGDVTHKVVSSGP